MITYRQATVADAESIAQLHSISWQQNYKGIWSDDFLNGPVVENRRALWQHRLTQPSLNQWIIAAELAGEICGFACAYTADDPVWGTLLDNLHVRKDLKRQGVGRQLMQLAAKWASDKNPDAGFYLWVLAQNTSARDFYDRVGGINQEMVSLENPDGSFSDCYRYVWPDVRALSGGLE